ncbi:MAG: GAF domain-containing protein [Bacteroidota bacterium]|nr:GAF domain-containing protein [Bacteroidota bacterium]
MKFRFTIGTKISLGFGILILAVIVNMLLNSKILNKSIQVNQNIENVYEPSEDNLRKIREHLRESEMLIKSWVFIEKSDTTPDKLRLVRLQETIFPRLNENIQNLKDQWKPEEREAYNKIYRAIQDTLIVRQRYIMNLLNSKGKYNEYSIMMQVAPMVSEKGEIVRLTERIQNQLSHLITNQQDTVKNGKAELFHLFGNFQRFLLITGILLVIISLVISFFMVRSIVRSLKRIKSTLQTMSRGILPDTELEERSDEIGEMSVALNSLIQGLKNFADFSEKIGKGNFESKFQPLSDEDVLGNSLINLREDLKNASLEEQKRKKEDAQRNWTNQGMAKFSEILRNNNHNMEELSYHIISNLVQYLGANQGGLFIINDNKENPSIDLSACYAYDRRKYLQKHIEPGEGLVGRCVREGETIFMTDIPDRYIRITSGLGEANPKCLLIVPLKLNEEIFGVIEIASFEVIEPYQVAFVEKIGESIASTISTVKINIRTAELLEQSQQQAEEMSSQEEEMRQNMEELRATQEQSSRREQELLKTIEGLKGKLGNN